MFSKLGVQVVELDAVAVLEGQAALELRATDSARALVAPRSAIVEVRVRQQDLKIHAVPEECRGTAADKLRCVCVAGVDEDRRDAVIALMVAVLRTGQDLRAADAVRAIANESGRLDCVALSALGSRSFSMPAQIRRLIGESAISQDRAAGILKESVPKYVTLDSMVPYWDEQVVRLLGSSPYAFWLPFQSVLEKQVAPELHQRAIDRVVGYVRKGDTAGLERTAATVKDLEVAA